MKRFSVVVLCLIQLVMLVASESQSSVPAPSLAPSSPATEPCRIDTHCHYVPPFYKTLLDSRNITSGGKAVPSWNVSAHLELNAEIGVETSIVSVSIPGAKLSQDDSVDYGRQLARELNEYGYNLTLEYPKKFLFFATLTLPDLDGAVAEAIYALDTLNAAGVALEANSFGELLGTPRLDPLYKVLNDRHAVAFIHPSNSPCPNDNSTTDESTGLPSYVIDFLLDTSRAALNLVYRNVTRDYPNITFILAHSGGFLSFAATRAADGLYLLAGDGRTPTEFLDELSKFNIDLALSATSTALPSTTAFFNSSRITYGTDFPYAPVQGITSNTNSLQSYRLHNAARRDIDYNNAYRLFKWLLN